MILIRKFREKMTLKCFGSFNAFGMNKPELVFQIYKGDGRQDNCKYGLKLLRKRTMIIASFAIS